MSTGSATAGAAPAVGAERTSPYAWLVLSVLMFIYIFNFLDRQLMSILIESIKRDTGFTDTQMGMMTGFYFALFYTVFGVIVGSIADKTSRRNILFAGAFLWSLFTALCGIAKTYPTMLAARVGVGVGEAAGAPPSYSIISDYFPPEKRGLALALFSLGVPFGQALGAAFGAALDASVGWRNAFLGIGAAGIVASFVLLLVVREPKRGAMDHSATVSREQAAANAAEKISFVSTIWSFVNRPVLLWAALACGLCSFVGYCALGWNASFLIRVKGITREELAVWYAGMLAVSMGLGTFFSGAIVDWLAKRSKVWYALLPAIAFTLATPFWFAYVWVQGWELSVAVLALPTFFTIMYLAPALALVQNSVKPSQRTMSGAILLMVLNIIGLGGGPTMVGILSDIFKNQAVASGMETAAAGAQGLQTAFYWVTPFYAVAVGFLLLQASAIRREIKLGAAVRDGGFRLGLVLAAVGLVGLYLRYQSLGIPGAIVNFDRIGTFGTLDLTGQIDVVMDVFTSRAMTAFAIGGVFLVVSGLTRKKTEPAAA
jgi:predicted MFS family arabinose efflux permease